MSRTRGWNFLDAYTLELAQAHCFPSMLAADRRMEISASSPVADLSTSLLLMARVVESMAKHYNRFDLEKH